MDEKQKISGTKFLKDPSYDLYSPRTQSMVIGKLVLFDRGENVIYVSERNYENIFDFVFSCRINKNAGKPKFAMGTFNSIDEINRSARECYIIVSGEKLPSDIPKEEKLLIQRYIIYGLMQLNLYHQRNLSEEKIVNVNNEAKITSSGKHPFQKEDSWAMDMSNLFMGMLIDYYNISTNISKQDSQQSFIMNPDFRKVLYDYLNEIFIKFIQTNSGKSFYASSLNISKINSEVLTILNDYIK